MKNTIKLSTVTVVILMTLQLEAGDVLSGVSNTANSTLAVVVGGQNNNINSNSNLSTIGGGSNNDSANSGYGVIGGGRSNGLSTGMYGVISGGYLNRIQQSYSTISGGILNKGFAAYTTISGGKKNSATGIGSTIAGGIANQATGKNSVVGGGTENNATGEASFAMGEKNLASGRCSVVFGKMVKAGHDGSVVFGDSNGAIGTYPLSERSSDVKNRFYGFFENGYKLYTTAGRTGNSGVYLNGGDGAWNTLSDKNQKENFQEVNKEEVLNKLIAMPVETWNYKTQNNKIRHIGPYAQDFNKAYGLGDGKLSISTIDSDGIALVSVQALAERNRILNQKNQKLEEKFKRLSERLSKIESSL